jgi:drug/metabolite transporter (DMT)-like permease
MSVAALGFALAAAILHAVWNLLLRGTRDAEAATAVAVVVFAAVLAPFAVATWRVDGAAWKYIVPSAALELVYVALLAAAYRRFDLSLVYPIAPLLAAAYRRFDLSLVYPIARGLAPVAALAIVVIVVGARPSPAEIGGVLVVAAGVLLVRGARGGRGGTLGLAIALVIGGYTVVDRYGIQHAGTFAYAFLIMLGAALAYPPFVGLRRVRAAVSRRTLLVGVLSAAAYVFVLLALRRASAPSVSAVRETSVVIAAALAAIFLRERVGPARFAGAILVAAGIALLALA